ncbi:hypothetical protein GUITHDRAFT_115036 [Guillardia theta CCMP2712]|uniref:CBM20 domain-containing protein n=1 Tax=Guillardia theta (strain CCMP2712) TaxID=905079 RepID=L1IRN7_GUITC|nr:hypothetical protein GUITHDRAFT_115036 [Guillardia theta CCMP2712]EKX38931.1 hypothetical protein GUITHDRAFT_115036 [Guillardia theta CCMP2712]|eukprot:XP_005825911.1 hypothetical protein GUITHDRAFT_115036 [Guillardia theta CCMP2712]
MPNPRICLLVALIATMVANTSTMRVLWMGGDDKPDSTMKRNGDKPRAGYDDSTDKLLQAAIRNIDQLTSVARELSQENISPAVLKSASRTDLPSLNGNKANQPKPVQNYQPQWSEQPQEQPRAPPQQCALTFRLKNDITQPGDTVLVVGNVPELGEWKPQRAAKLSTNSGSFPYWNVAITLRPGFSLEYKFVIQKSGGELVWEKGENRKIKVPVSSKATAESAFGEKGERISGVDAAVVEARAPSPPAAIALYEPEAPMNQESATLHLRVKCTTNPGESVFVCGGHPSIGGWDPVKAVMLKTNKDDYPHWSGTIQVPVSATQKENIRYKYVVKDSNGQSRWEDAIADRVLMQESKKPGGVLSINMHTYVDDGSFNCLQRVCTYVRDGKERPRTPSTALATTPPPQIPAGMQVVSIDQVRQWEARVAELEDECESLRERARAAEASERRVNEEIMEQMKFVEELLQRMKKMEETVTTLEETKDVLITRSESMNNLQAMGSPPSATKSAKEGIADSIEEGLANAKQILNNIDRQLTHNQASSVRA